MTSNYVLAIPDGLLLGPFSVQELNAETEAGRLWLPDQTQLRVDGTDRTISARRVEGLRWQEDAQGPSEEVVRTDRAAGWYVAGLGLLSLVNAYNKGLLDVDSGGGPPLAFVLVFCGAWWVFKSQSKGFWVGLLYGGLCGGMAVAGAANSPGSFSSPLLGFLSVALVVPFAVLFAYCLWRVIHGQGPNALYVAPSLVAERSASRNVGMANLEPSMPYRPGPNSAHRSLEPLRATVTTLAPPGVPKSPPDVIDGLERLTRLRQDGALTDEEFALAKSGLLARGRDA